MKEKYLQFLLNLDPRVLSPRLSRKDHDLFWSCGTQNLGAFKFCPHGRVV